MRNSKTQLLSAAFITLICLSPVAGVSADEEISTSASALALQIEVNSLRREALVHLPDTYQPARAYPVVMIFHGGGQDARKIMEITQFNDASNKDEFIAVYPEGRNHRWNDGRKLPEEAARELTDDLSFVRELLNQINKKWRIDHARIYATGFSNGGLFCQRLGCQLSEKFAAIAPVSASMSEEQYARPGVHTPVSVAMFFGKNDPIEHWDGGEIKADGKSYGRIAPVQDVVKFWAKTDGCGHRLSEVQLSHDNETNVFVERYLNDKSRSEVLLYRIEGGGHTWPGSSYQPAESTYGKTCHCISATELIWDFFKEHPSTAPFSAADRSDSEYAPIEKIAGGTIGAFAVNLQTGKTTGLHENEPFPLASVVKFPVALAILKKVDEEKFSLDDKVHLAKSDTFEVGHSPLTVNFPATGLDITFKELIRYSICESDTTAGEILLQRAGGPAAVQRFLAESGCPGISVVDSECNLSLRYEGVDPASVKSWDKATVNKLLAAVPARQKQESAARFMRNPGNVATPRAMAELFAKLRQGKLLRPATTDYILSVLEQTQTFPHRINGLLPPGTVVGHKTGTWGTSNGVNAATNDSGIVNLPHGRGQICMAAFIKGSDKKLDDRELAIATFAKSAYNLLSAE